ncbi:MAG: hypothetical protein ACJ790_20285 [Myxococcaceae bacterium]
MMLAVLMLASLGASAGESEQTRSAREEVERQLDALVNIPNPVATISFMGLEEPPFELVEARFLLDGKVITPPSLTELGKAQQTQIFRGDVVPGSHMLTSTVAWIDRANMMFSESSGYTFRVTTKTTFTAQRGLETRLVLTPERDPSARERKDQFKLHSTATPVIIEVKEEPLTPPPLIEAEVELQPAAPIVAPVDAGVPPTPTKTKKRPTRNH